MVYGVGMEKSTDTEKLRIRILESPHTQAEICRRMKMDVGLFSKRLRGAASMTNDLVAQVNALLDVLERADAAAAQARERVLAGENDAN